MSNINSNIIHGYLFELAEVIFHLALSREGNVYK